MEKTNAIHFTKKTILHLPLPKQGRATYHDVSKRGLVMIVFPSGTKTFALYRKINGKPERITIGRFPDMTVEQARSRADVLNAKIASGTNPNEERRLLRAEMTLQELFDLYLERHAKLHKRSWKSDQDQFARYLLPWKQRKLSSLHKADIQKLHANVADNHGLYAANRLLALIHTLFNKATEWGWQQTNPAHGVKKFKERSRERFLQADELPRFFQALAEEPNEMIKDYILLSLLTGARKSNVLAMRWDEINLDRATWAIPMTKNGEAHVTPLVDQALEILKRKLEKTDSSPWVFPSTGKTGHLVEPKKVWRRLLIRAQLADLRLHDLRRSLGSWQAATGASLSIIGKTLAHKNVNTTAIYARLNIDPVREAMNKATQAIFDAATAK